MAKGRRPIAAIAGALIKSIAISAIILILSFAVMRVSPLLGVALMLAFSGIMIVRTSRRDMPLNRVTALLPGGMALLCYLLQLAVSGIGDPTWVLTGAAVGVALGWLIGRGHRVYMKGRQLFAHRTIGAVSLWVATYLLGQATTLLGLRQIASVALGLGGFSTAMVVALSGMLFVRASRFAPRRQAAAGAAAASWLLIGALTAGLAVAPLPRAPAQAAVTVNNALEGLTYIVQHMNAPMPQIAGPRVKDISGQPMASPDASAATVTFTNGQNTDIGDTEFVTVGLLYSPDFEGRQDAMAREMIGDGQQCRAVSGPPGVRIVVCDGSNLPDNFFTGVFGGKWTAQVAVGVAGGANTRKEQARQMAASISLDVARLMGDLVHGSVSGGLIPPIGPSGLGDAVNQIVAGLTGGGDVPDEVLGAGVAAAVAQLLAGIGMAAAAAAAQAAAAAAQAAAQAAATGGTRILDGEQAIDWMRDHGYIDDTGRHTDRFTDFMTALPSESGPGLQGYAGDLDGNGNPGGDIAIVVGDDVMPPRSPDVDQPVEPEPPAEPEAPPEEPPPEDETSPPPPPTRIVEPIPPDEPQEEEKPEDEAPVEKDPCHDKIVRFDEICDECETLLDEVHRLTIEKNALYQAIEDKVASAGFCAFADILNVLATAATAPLTTFLGSTWASLLSTAGFEGLKHEFRSFFGQNPDIADAVKSGAPSGGAAVGGGAWKAFLDWMVEAGVKGGGNRAALEAATEGLKLAGPGAQMVLTAGAGGYDFSSPLVKEVPLMLQRYDNLVKLRDQSRRVLDEAIKRRNAAERLLDDCLKRGT